VLVTLASCTPPARVQTLEAEQRRLREDVVALETKVRELEGRFTTLGKRLGANAAAGRKAEREPEPTASRTLDATASQRATPTPIPTRLPELDIDGLRRESSRQLPAGYRRGIDLIRAGAYEDGIRVLREFVRTEHASPYVPSAHYWIGQAHMQLGQSYQAILAFTDVQQRAPRSALAPAAGLATGVAFLELGNATEARRAFERVVTEYPNAPEAAKAEARLRGLERRAP